MLEQIIIGRLDDLGKRVGNLKNIADLVQQVDSKEDVSKLAANSLTRTAVQLSVDLIK